MEGTEMDYVNERPSPEQKHSKGANQTGFTERRLCMLLLSFGVLCIIQATLNVSLRLSLYSRSRSTPCNTSQFKDQTQGVQIDCERRRNNAFNMLQDRFNAQARDKNLLENRISELNNMIKTVQEERDRLRVRVRELEGCLSDSSCPAGWKEINSRCYFLSTESKTWQDSRNHCQSQAADLVVIDSVQEQRALYRLDGDSYLLFWIGLHDTAGTFRWVDGSVLTAPFWQSGQPDRGGPNNIEDCVEMYHRSPELANWNDARCGDKRKWLCEKAANTC